MKVSINLKGEDVNNYVDKVRQIFEQSNCPNESLINTFGSEIFDIEYSNDDEEDVYDIYFCQRLDVDNKTTLQF